MRVKAVRQATCRDDGCRVGVNLIFKARRVLSGDMGTSVVASTVRSGG